MKTATVRKVQHHLSEVLRWVQDGEEVLITKRGRVVAKLSPAKDNTKPAKPIKWPDFIARAERIWGKKGVRGKSLSQIIIDDREDRF